VFDHSKSDLLEGLAAIVTVSCCLFFFANMSSQLKNGYPTGTNKLLVAVFWYLGAGSSLLMFLTEFAKSRGLI